MKTEEFQLTNMKCQGCVQTIQNELTKMDPKLKVSIDLTNQQLIIESKNTLDRHFISNILDSIGFPEKKEQ
ncbi:MAG: heavy-metal-associated domain-containing protein [Saprospiraceae bacterium]|nr:heavy-metal-associated domain-containing protein [Saprospiraceae bacterium]